MVYNGGGLQVFYDKCMDPIYVPSRFIADITAPRSLEKIEHIKSAAVKFSTAKTILLARAFALGDVLMLIPVAREVRERFSNIERVMLATIPEIFNSGIFQELSKSVFDVVGRFYDMLSQSYDVGVLLDGILERDHYVVSYHSKHRVDIYREMFGLPTGQTPKWNLQSTHTGSHGVVFAPSGSTPIKQLPAGTIKYVEEGLRGRGFRKVITVGEGHRLPASELLSAIENARVLITMDSAPLWIGHYYATPIVLLSGPTRAAERLRYHPLYPDGVREVSLSKMVGCSPCFEQKTRCNGKVNCMNVKKELLLESVIEGVEAVMWRSR